MQKTYFFVLKAGKYHKLKKFNHGVHGVYGVHRVFNMNFITP